jgi:hypothetical protein
MDLPAWKPFRQACAGTPLPIYLEFSNPIFWFRSFLAEHQYYNFN